MYLLELLGPFLIGAVIVGKRWPPPRWFIGSSSPPILNNIVSKGVQVTSKGTDVVNL